HCSGSRPTGTALRAWVSRRARSSSSSRNRVDGVGVWSCIVRPSWKRVLGVVTLPRNPISSLPLRPRVVFSARPPPRSCPQCHNRGRPWRWGHGGGRGTGGSVGPACFGVGGLLRVGGADVGGDGGEGGQDRPEGHHRPGA